MNYLKITLGILVILATSRFVPHPPNFTSLIALSFYVPVFLGIRYIPALILCFAITDIFIGFHELAVFTWGSVVLIGLLTKYFSRNILFRISGALSGCFVFFIISNFGVWSLGSYSYDMQGFITCYTMALPFLGFSLISTFIFSGLIEGVYRINIIKDYLKYIRQ